MHLTKEELKQIYYLNKEIKMWQKELERLQCKSLIKGQEITGMPFVTGTSDKVGDMATTMADIEAIIRGKLAEIQLQRKKIIEYIESIGDSMMRQIIFLRNVSCMSWPQIANELGGNNTEDSVRKMYDRYIK
jgi:hypothetical protein